MNTTNDSFAFFQKRYKDAYFVSRLTSFIGWLLQFGAVVLAIIIIAAGVFAASKMSDPNGGSPQIATAIIAAAFMWGIIFGALFYILGVLVAAQGQLILATLDTAVSCTPLLADDQKFAIISRRAPSKP
jgi:uncharacterized membrane protein YjgN (DUF898 family)